MDPRHLLQLAEIIDRGSLASAAKALNVSQPTLTRNIQALECAIGGAVLHRGAQGVTATSMGNVLAVEGRAIRSSLRAAGLNLDNWKRSLDGRLRVGAGTMIAHSLMARFLANPSTEGWNVALWIDVGGANRLIERVCSNELDVCVVQCDPEFSKAGLTRLTLFEDKRAYYASKTHPLANRDIVSQDDIYNARHIAVGVFPDLIPQANPSGIGSFKSGPRIELSGDLAIALHLLSTGKYIASISEFVMAHLCESRTFKKLRYSGLMPRRMFSVWYMDDMRGHPLINEFCGRLRRFTSDLLARKKGRDI
jgi:DNA-binding transcriptional LysR family regulator